MSKKHPVEDKNFDGLSPRFKRNIYDSAKGQLRLAVLRRDFNEFVHGKALSVLDVGGGQGHWAIEMARLGHHVLLTDLSAEMLSHAKAHYQEAKQLAPMTGDVEFLQSPLQELTNHLGKQYDVVAAHAVLEWLIDPEQGFRHLLDTVKPGGWLSLIIYNVHGLVMKNLLRTNYKKVLAKDFRGYRGSLTPLNPLDPADVKQWIRASGFEEICCSGIRTFHDYVLDPEHRKQHMDQVIELELELSRREPYRSLGRYVHFLCQRPQ